MGGNLLAAVWGVRREESQWGLSTSSLHSSLELYSEGPQISQSEGGLPGPYEGVFIVTF